MKAKQGYKKHKTNSDIGKWLKRYFAKRTCRKRIAKAEDMQIKILQEEAENWLVGDGR